MTWSAFLLMLMFLVAGAIQWGLAIYTIRDAAEREQFRGPNKVSWVLIILCLPFLGPLLYITLATDGLPVPRPHPSSTWPGRRWRRVRRVAQAGESLIRTPEPQSNPERKRESASEGSEKVGWTNHDDGFWS